MNILEGKSLALRERVKYIEISCGLQHNIDELLVGTLKQIRLKVNQQKKIIHDAHRYRRSTTPVLSTIYSLNKAKEILSKYCQNKAKSCENLHVL